MLDVLDSQLEDVRAALGSPALLYSVWSPDGTDKMPNEVRRLDGALLAWRTEDYEILWYLGLDHEDS